MTATVEPTKVIHPDGSAVELSEFVDVLLERMSIDFATKEDLERFATKEDLEALRAEMATKEDLELYATKEELSEFRGEMTAWAFQMETKIDDLNVRVGNIEPRLTNIELLLKRVLRRLPPP